MTRRPNPVLPPTNCDARMSAPSRRSGSGSARRRNFLCNSHSRSYGGAAERPASTVSLHDNSHRNSEKRSLARSLAQYSGPPMSPEHNTRDEDDLLLDRAHRHPATVDDEADHRRYELDPAAVKLKTRDLELIPRHRRQHYTVSGRKDDDNPARFTRAPNMTSHSGGSPPPRLLEQQPDLNERSLRDCNRDGTAGPCLMTDDGDVHQNGRPGFPPFDYFPVVRHNDNYGSSGDAGGTTARHQPDDDPATGGFFVSRFPRRKADALIHRDFEASEGNALLQMIPPKTRSKLLDIAATLDISPTDVLGESLELLFTSLSRPRRHYQQTDEKEQPGGMTAADNPAAASAATRDCSSLIESSMEIFNYAHQRLAPNFPDVGVSLVVTPRNGRQLVFKSDYCMDSGSRHGPTSHDPHVQMDTRNPDLHAAAYGLTGARADYGQSDTMAHGSRPRRTRNLDPFYREPQAQLAGNGANHVDESRQHQEGSSIKDTVTVSERYSDRAVGDGRSNEDFVPRAEAGAGREGTSPKRLSTSKRKWRDVASQFPGRTGVSAEKEIQSSSAHAQSTEEPGYSDDDSDGNVELSADAPAHKRRICRQRWTQEQMQELRRVVTESVPYGRWEDVFQQSEVLRASHFTKQAVRKKAWRMGLVRTDVVIPSPNNSGGTRGGAAQVEGQVAGHHDQRNASPEPLPDAQAAECD